MSGTDIHQRPAGAVHGGLPRDRATLLACSDAYVAVELWQSAARLGELAVGPGDPDPAARLEVAWRLWRAGRPDATLALLAGLPEDTHPVLPVLRSAAVLTRDRTPDALAALLDEVSRLPPSGLTLKIVALAATAVGNREVARTAAARSLATVDAADAGLRRIMAPVQAAASDLGAAVSSTERACAGRVVDPDGPVEEVVAELREDGHGEVVHRFLAEGFHLTGRLRYGQLLVEHLPARILHRDIWIIGPLLVVAGMLLVVIPTQPPGALGWAVVVAVACGLALSVRGVLLRAPGAGIGQTIRIGKAVSRYRSRTGTSSLVLPVGGMMVAGFGYGLLKAYTRTTFIVAPLLAVGLGVLMGGLAGGVMLVVGRRKRARLTATGNEQVAAEHCRCWERDWFAGPTWHAYLAEHLVQTAADPQLDAVLLQCPATRTVWLHSPHSDVSVRLVLPGRPVPEPESAAYL